MLAGKHLAIWGTKSGFYPSPAEAACSAPGSGRDSLSRCNGNSFPKYCRRTMTKSLGRILSAGGLDHHHQ